MTPAARPSVHGPITKSYAIDQITDTEHLRAVAHRMWEAFSACHAQYAHVLGAILHDECEDCRVAFLNHDIAPCDRPDGRPADADPRGARRAEGAGDARRAGATARNLFLV